MGGGYIEECTFIALYIVIYCTILLLMDLTYFIETHWDILGAETAQMDVLCFILNLPYPFFAPSLRSPLLRLLSLTRAGKNGAPDPRQASNTINYSNVDLFFICNRVMSDITDQMEVGGLQHIEF